jgi:hypothetical protein
VFAEASTILRAVTADFFFNCTCLEIPSDNRIRHIKAFPPSCVKLSIWKYSRISVLDRTPELYSVSPDCFEYCFIYRKFVACGEF